MPRATQDPTPNRLYYEDPYSDISTLRMLGMLAISLWPWLLISVATIGLGAIAAAALVWMALQ